MHVAKLEGQLSYKMGRNVQSPLEYSIDGGRTYRLT